MPIPSGEILIVEGNYARSTKAQEALDISNIISNIIAGVYDVNDKRFILNFISMCGNKEIYYSADTDDEIYLSQWDQIYNKLVNIINSHNSYKIKSKNDLNKSFDNKMV